MIKLTRMNGTVILMNESFIACAEETPDTVVTLQNGHKYIVKESVDEIYEKILSFEKEKRSDGI
ncbi:MAG: flagellar FlbD family protein [Huintestinicola sp.]